ncbi:MAG: alpha-galactosidase [Fimbriimonadaceae bacterium]|nr:alpha-galactosidase [Fimbriimonadaceae bacterium]
MADCWEIAGVGTITLLEGSLASGQATLRVTPATEHLRWLVSERSMGNARATLPFGSAGSSYTWLGLLGEGGALLLAAPVPLPELAQFVISGDHVSLTAPGAVRLDHGPDATALLLEYGERHRRPHLPAPIRGWNSWDAFNASVTLDDVLDNAHWLADDEVIGPLVSHLIVDDGWMTNWGEWTPNGKFPGGMDLLAERLNLLDKIPGLWLAPLMVEPVTPLYQRHPECFLRDREGHPYLVNHGFTRTTYALDVSVPRTREFLHQTFRRVASWGYRYVKLDFLYNQAECLERGDATAADPDWTTTQHIATMLQIARQELGPLCHILGCNYPYELGGQGVDEARLTCDIASFRQNVELCYQSHSARFHLTGRWMATDPDFAVVRVPGVTWDEGPLPFHVTPAWNRHERPGGWRRGAFWDEELMRVALTMVILSGGSVILGDHLPQLNARGRDYLRLALTWGGGQPAWPLDLSGHRPAPCLWRNDRLLAAYNLGPTPLRLPLPADLALGDELFTHAPAPADTLALPPGTAQLYALDP